MVGRVDIGELGILLKSPCSSSISLGDVASNATI
jgi:hypothetical protein